MAVVIEKDELQRLIDDGKKVKDIAEMLHVGHQYVYKLIAKYGIEINPRTKYTEDSLKQIQQLYDQGFTMEQAAVQLHMTYSAIGWVTRRYHLNPPKVKKALPKLMQIRSQYYTDHLSVAEIADRWGVTEEEMRSYMTEHKFFSKGAGPIKTHETGDDIPSTFFDDWFHTCPVCGKSFAVRDCRNYAYKVLNYKRMGSKSFYFCSWSCIQKFCKDESEKKVKKGKTHEER